MWDSQVVIFRLTELQVIRTELPVNRILLISKTSFTKYYKHLCSHQPDLILNIVYLLKWIDEWVMDEWMDERTDRSAPKLIIKAISSGQRQVNLWN